MIVKDIPKSDRPKKTVSTEGARRASTRAIIAILRYVTDDDLGLELKLEPSETDVENETKAIINYLISERPDPGVRVQNILCQWSDEPEEIAPREFLDRTIVLMADVDISHFRHIVIADPHATQDQIFSGLRDVYGPIASIILVEHGDSLHRHFHAVVVTVDPKTGRGFQTNKGYDHEKLHMMAAKIDWQNGTPPEPNALFLSDGAAIYDRWTGAKVADFDLNIDVPINQKVRRNRIGLMADNEAAQHVIGWQKHLEAGEGMTLEAPDWDLNRVAKTMVRPRIVAAQNWDEVHNSLAMIGVRYSNYRGGGRLEFGDAEEYLAASAAVSTASLKEMERRIGIYQPPPSTCKMLHFVRPKFLLNAEKKAELAGKSDARKSVKADNAEVQRRIDQDFSGTEQELDRDEARANLKAITRTINLEITRDTQFRRNRFCDKEPDVTPLDAFLFNHNPSQSMSSDTAMDGYLRKQYRGKAHWYLGDKLCLIETNNLIMLTKGADKKAALKLAQNKWGNDFRFYGTDHQVHEFCVAAAELGILAGNAEQRKMIEHFIDQAAQFEIYKSKEAANDKINERVKTLKANRAMDRQAQRKAFDTSLQRSKQNHALIENDIQRKGFSNRARYPSAYLPHERRGMLALQKSLNDAPKHVIESGDQPLGHSLAWVRTALGDHPEDLETPLVQSRLWTEFYRQEAERIILWEWVKRKEAKFENERILAAKKEKWLADALVRENDNPAFLKDAQFPPDTMPPSLNRDIAALAIAMSTPYLNVAEEISATVIQELAWTVKQTHGPDISSHGHIHLFDGMDKKLRLRVIGAVQNAPNKQPTLVIDQTLIKNMTPAQRAAARRKF